MHVYLSLSLSLSDLLRLLPLDVRRRDLAGVAPEHYIYIYIYIYIHTYVCICPPSRARRAP